MRGRGKREVYHRAIHADDERANEYFAREKNIISRFIFAVSSFPLRRGRFGSIEIASEPSPSQKENIPNEDDEEEEEKIRLMLDDFEEKDAHGRGFILGSMGWTHKADLCSGVVLARARMVSENAHKAKFSSSSDESICHRVQTRLRRLFRRRDPKPMILRRIPQNIRGDARSMASMGSDSNTTTSSNGNTAELTVIAFGQVHAHVQE